MSESAPQPDDNRPQVLVIDDEPVVSLSCDRVLTPKGYAVTIRQSAPEGLEEALTDRYDLILLDIVMPVMNGLQVLKGIKQGGAGAAVIIITGYADVNTAVEAMKQGAVDYITKPFTPDELLVAVQRALERSALVRENVRLRTRLADEAEESFHGIIGQSRAMERLYDLMRRVGPTDGTVLLTGESGTGKEMVARALHDLSRRASRPFVACDCSALASTLLESELFGHVKGSFSGAIASKKGLFEIASGGTLFLDEIANISLETQGKLLRALETRRIRPVGDILEHEIDIRLIAATNRSLVEMVRAGEFREDLYYRLNVVPIELPPLRRRQGDIPLLASVFLDRFRRSGAARAAGFTPEAIRILESYPWPGNVRELRNIVERVAILAEGERITVEDLPPSLTEEQEDSWELMIPDSWDDFKEMKKKVREAAVEDLERRFLVRALEKAGGNVSRAAESVGMQRTNFHALLSKYDINSRGEAGEE